ncbi:hypothetical protein OBBRIDRAFT_386698 [Obba rivulosa]|uniref:Uncharacterized protein n=1 Tax=Obba rivulosa TaxID=1052685 RepID=A0A8E2DNH1_9APHY|nr:hypothetical protein OBBRIDRAFT_386698 [Obba rivulosa]
MGRDKLRQSLLASKGQVDVGRNRSITVSVEEAGVQANLVCLAFVMLARFFVTAGSPPFIPDTRITPTAMNSTYIQWRDFISGNTDELGD